MKNFISCAVKAQKAKLMLWLNMTTLVLLVLATSLPAQNAAQDPEVLKLQRELDRRNVIAGSRYVDNPQVRGALSATNGAGFLAEEVIADKATKLGIPNPTDAEMHSMLLPMLVQQGLVDADCADIFRDPNVSTWIKGQDGMTWSDFRTAAKTLVLWTKIAIQNIEITEDSVRAYVERNPGMATIPAKVRIVLTQYVPPRALASRSVMPHEVLAPTFAFATRAATADLEKPIPKAYEHLNLWVELDKVDPALREVLGGQAVGFEFPSIPLKNQAIVEGRIVGFSPERNLLSDPNFWAMAAVRARLAKADQAAEFEKIVTVFLNDETRSPAVRGFWKKIWGGVKKSFQYITGFAGGALAFTATGSPQAAFLGAKMGYQFGNAIKGWFSSGQITRPQFPAMPQGGGIQIPPGYLSGGQFSMPPASNSWPGYPPMNTMPPMPYNYSPYAPPMPNNPYYSPMQDGWSPQMFFPQPVGYYF
jgi:hypothetical protein